MSAFVPQFSAYALPNVPLVRAGDDLLTLIVNGVADAQLTLQDGDVLVLASKIVSKAEGRQVRLADVIPSAQAQELANVTGKDARIVELVLRESVGVSRAARNVLVVQHRLGFVSANAGIDQSNIEDGSESALLLPLDPDGTARALCEALQQRFGCTVGVVISDTHGRPFRLGNVGVAIGVAGLQALTDLRGRKDLFGRVLQITQQGYADLLASAAHLLTGEADEARPIVLLRGLELPLGDGKASDLYRPPEQDLYR